MAGTLLRTSRGARGVRPNGPYTLNRASAQATNLSRCYPLDGPTTQEIVIGRSWPGVAVGRKGHPALGAASYFSGASGSYLDVTAPTFLAGSTAFSLSLWAMTETTASSGGGGGLRYLAATEGAGPSGQFTIRYSPGGGVFQAYIWPSQVGVSSTTTIAANTLYQVGVTLNAASGGTLTIYINGRAEATTTSAGVMDSTVTALTFGNDGGFDGRARQWNGLLGHAALYPQDIGPHGMWNLYESQRWDLLAVPSTRVYFDQGAAAAALAARRQYMVRQASNRAATF